MEKVEKVQGKVLEEVKAEQQEDDLYDDIYDDNYYGYGNHWTGNPYENISRRLKLTGSIGVVRVF